MCLHCGKTFARLSHEQLCSLCNHLEEQLTIPFHQRWPQEAINRLKAMIQCDCCSKSIPDPSQGGYFYEGGYICSTCTSDQPLQIPLQQDPRSTNATQRSTDMMERIGSSSGTASSLLSPSNFNPNLPVAPSHFPTTSFPSTAANNSGVYTSVPDTHPLAPQHLHQYGIPPYPPQEQSYPQQQQFLGPPQPPFFSNNPPPPPPTPHQPLLSVPSYHSNPVGHPHLSSFPHQHQHSTQTTSNDLLASAARMLAGQQQHQAYIASIQPETLHVQRAEEASKKSKKKKTGMKEVARQWAQSSSQSIFGRSCPLLLSLRAKQKGVPLQAQYHSYKSGKLKPNPVPAHSKVVEVGGGMILAETTLQCEEEFSMSVLETFRALQKSAAPNHPALLINDQRKPYTYFHRRGNQLVTVNRIELGMSVRDFWTRVSRSNELAGQPSTKSLDLVVYLDMDVLDPTPENYHEEHDNDYINDSEDSLPVKRARLSEALIDDLSEDDDQDRLLSLSVPELAAFQVRHPGNIEGITASGLPVFSTSGSGSASSSSSSRRETLSSSDSSSPSLSSNTNSRLPAIQQQRTAPSNETRRFPSVPRTSTSGLSSFSAPHRNGGGESSTGTVRHFRSANSGGSDSALLLSSGNGTSSSSIDGSATSASTTGASTSSTSAAPLSSASDRSDATLEPFNPPIPLFSPASTKYGVMREARRKCEVAFSVSSSPPSDVWDIKLETQPHLGSLERGKETLQHLVEEVQRWEAGKLIPSSLAIGWVYSDIDGCQSRTVGSGPTVYALQEAMSFLLTNSESIFTTSPRQGHLYIPNSEDSDESGKALRAAAYFELAVLIQVSLMFYGFIPRGIHPLLLHILVETPFKVPLPELAAIESDFASTLHSLFTDLTLDSSNLFDKLPSIKPLLYYIIPSLASGKLSVHRSSQILHQFLNNQPLATMINSIVRTQTFGAAEILIGAFEKEMKEEFRRVGALATITSLGPSVLHKQFLLTVPSPSEVIFRPEKMGEPVFRSDLPDSLRVHISTLLFSTLRDLSPSLGTHARKQWTACEYETETPMQIQISDDYAIAGHPIPKLEVCFSKATLPESFFFLPDTQLSDRSMETLAPEQDVRERIQAAFGIVNGVAHQLDFAGFSAA